MCEHEPKNTPDTPDDDAPMTPQTGGGDPPKKPPAP